MGRLFFFKECTYKTCILCELYVHLYCNKERKTKPKKMKALISFCDTRKCYLAEVKEIRKQKSSFGREYIVWKPSDIKNVELVGAGEVETGEMIGHIGGRRVDGASYVYEVTEEQYNNIVAMQNDRLNKKREKDQIIKEKVKAAAEAKKEKINSCYKKAAETNNKVEIRKYMEIVSKNDSEDYVYYTDYAMPDGTRKTEKTVINMQ